jgi:DNA invertase Pin-like site-specific DNA recombinase
VGARMRLHRRQEGLLPRRQTDTRRRPTRPPSRAIYPTLRPCNNFLRRGLSSRRIAYGYMRTSSSSNIGTDKDSEKRQRAAIEGYADANGITIVGWYYDKAVRGSDPVTARPGFADMLVAIAADSVRAIIVESPDRFARDLAVQLAGHDHLRRLGVTLIPASAPDHFTEETPTAVLVRQVLGASHSSRRRQPWRS